MGALCYFNKCQFEEVQLHAILLIKWLQGKADEYLFTIPKMYNTKNGDSYIEDRFHCKAKTHQKRYIKGDTEGAKAYGQYFAWSYLVANQDTNDVESCLDEKTGKLAIMDFGNTKMIAGSSKDIFKQDAEQYLATHYIKPDIVQGLCEGMKLISTTDLPSKCSE